MKKLFISAVAAIMAASISASAADDVTNMVNNGDFEAPGVVAAVPDGYTWSPWNTYEAISELPGWCNISTGGEWNGILRMLTLEGDDELRPESDMKILRFLGYNDNGWTKIQVSNHMKGLVAGRTYHLDFLCAVSVPTAEECSNVWAPDPDYGFQVTELMADGSNGPEILSTNLASTSYDLGKEFYEVIGPFDFTAPANGEANLTFYLDNQYGDKNKHDVDLWMNIDLVRVYSDEGGEEGAGVEMVNADNNVAPVYYNLQGVRVANPENGLFIKKQGAKVSKVVL